MKKFLIHIRNWIFTSLIVATLMGSVMTLFIVVSEEATFEEITLSDIRYGLVLAFITSAFVIYPIFGLMLRRSRSTPAQEINHENEKPDITNSWPELLKTSFKWGLILFILVALTNYLTQNNFDILFSLKYGFGGGVLAALFTRTLVNAFLNSKEPAKSDIPEQTNTTNQPVLFNWIVATISSTFVFLMGAFLIHSNIYSEYTDKLINVYFPTAIILGVAHGQWVRIRNNKIKKRG
ncbi:hypothetical protein [Marinoscillum luteum]|uniref:DUF5671 domain-containing protein n=1 Tax=Marinoscillum luteum TaxID=861051 RepID=A0ABW7N7Q4_9BACT